MAKNQLNYLQNLEHCLEFGQHCRRNRRHTAMPYCVSNLGPLVQVTYRCEICNQLQETLYNTSWYLQACNNLNFNPDTLKPLATDPYKKD